MPKIAVRFFQSIRNRSRLPIGAHFSSIRVSTMKKKRSRISNNASNQRSCFACEAGSYNSRYWRTSGSLSQRTSLGRSSRSMAGSRIRSP